MLEGNCSKSLILTEGIYNSLIAKGLDIYSIKYTYSIWRSHREGVETSSFIFLLPARKNTDSSKKVSLSEDDIKRLTSYDKKMFRSCFPLEEIISGKVSVRKVKDINLEVLKILMREYIIHG
ncbi:MAG: hypothetical protein AABW81_01695 [Nanoarchaeota archaeon]